MKLLRIEAQKPGDESFAPVVQWVGTQAAAAALRKELVSDKGFRRDEVETEEVDVPTSKAELLDWLNEHKV